MLHAKVDGGTAVYSFVNGIALPGGSVGVPNHPVTRNLVFSQPTSVVPIRPAGASSAVGTVGVGCCGSRITAIPGTGACKAQSAHALSRSGWIHAQRNRKHKKRNQLRVLFFGTHVRSPSHSVQVRMGQPIVQCAPHPQVSGCGGQDQLQTYFKIIKGGFTLGTIW
jgi:hypothetical protein